MQKTRLVKFGTEMKPFQAIASMWVGAVPGGSLLWSLALGLMIAHFRPALHPPTCLLLLEAITFIDTSNPPIDWCSFKTKT